MRWFWIDKFLEFESGRRAVAVKNVALAEDHIDDYQPGHPVMPVTLVIEGLAQTGGLLVGEVNEFLERVVLAKVSRARFEFSPRPGDTLTYTATIDDIKEDGAFVSGTSYVGDRLQGEVQLCFAHLDRSNGAQGLFEPADFLRMLRCFRLFDVARKPDGSPVAIPARLLEAERIANAEGIV